MTTWETYRDAHVSVCGQCLTAKRLTGKCFSHVQRAYHEFRKEEIKRERNLNLKESEDDRDQGK